MADRGSAPGARRAELLELAYRYVLEHGLANLSLRPLAAAVGSSPRVLLYLFGSKDGLVDALQARAHAEERLLLGQVCRVAEGTPPGLDVVVRQAWSALSAQEHRSRAMLWVEASVASLVDPDGAWARFARATAEDWLEVLAAAQPGELRDTMMGRTERALVLAVLRGALLDLLDTGDLERTTAAVGHCATVLRLGHESADRSVLPGAAGLKGL